MNTAKKLISRSPHLDFFLFRRTIQYTIVQLSEMSPKNLALISTAAKSLQSCLTLCDPIDGSPWGSPVPGILQARTLEWVAVSFSNAWKWKVKVKSLSRVQLLATPWTAAHQASPFMGFSRQECWSGVPLPSPLNLTSHSKPNLQISLPSYNWNHIHVSFSFFPPK